MSEQTQPAADERKMTFEQALDRLEAIVKGMEGGQVGLEKMMAGFEEGLKLVAFCTRKLNEVEKKIEILAKQGDAVVAQSFQPTPAAGEAGPREDDPF